MPATSVEPRAISMGLRKLSMLLMTTAPQITMKSPSPVRPARRARCRGAPDQHGAHRHTDRMKVATASMKAAGTPAIRKPINATIACAPPCRRCDEDAARRSGDDREHFGAQSARDRSEARRTIEMMRSPSR